MDEMEDDFGTLYANVIDTRSSSSINSFPNLFEFISNPIQTQQNERHEATISTQDPNIQPDSEPIEEETGSDSEDDGYLNIVLNDEDYRNEFGVLGAAAREGGGFVGDESTEIAGGRGSSNDSHYKFKRSGGPVKIDYSKTNLFLEAASSSTAGRGVWDNGGESIHKGQIHKAPAHSPNYITQNKYSFSLPWYRTILDVNIDAFKEKPWRNPGVNMTDFFNFGLDEGSWRHYCNSLVNECGAGHEELVSENKCEKSCQVEEGGNSLFSMRLSAKRVHKSRLKGRPIEVEESSGERLPSMVIRRQYSYDSDVVIQIALQDSLENSTYACEKPLGCMLNSRKASENGDMHEGDSGDTIRTHTINEDALSVDNLQGDSGRLDGSDQLKRDCGQTNASDLSDLSIIESQKISNGIGSCNQDTNIGNQDTSNVKMEESVKKLDSGVQKVPFVEELDLLGTEEQLSLGGDSQLGLSYSCSESESETSEDCLTVDAAKVHSGLRRSSFSSHEELHDSVTPECKHRDNDVRMKLTNEKDYSSSRSYNYKKHWGRRTRDGESPLSNLGDSYNCDTSIPYSRWNGGHLGFDNCCTKRSSSDREMVCCDEAADDLSHAELFSSREGNWRLRYGINQYPERKWDEKDSSCLCTSYGENKRDRYRDCDACGKRKISTDRTAYSYGESRRLLSRSSCSVNGRENEVKMKTGAHLLSNRVGKEGHFLDHNLEDRYMTSNRRIPQYSGKSERDFFVENYIRKPPHRREMIGFEKGNVHRRSSPLIAYESWASDWEDGYLGSSDQGSLWLHRETCATERGDHDRYPRRKYYGLRSSRENLRSEMQPDDIDGRVDMMSDAYYKIDYLEDDMDYSDDYQMNLEKRGYGREYMLFQQPEEELFFRHQDDGPLSEEVLMSRRNPRHGKEHLIHKHSHGRMFEDDFEAEDNRSTKIREENSIFMNRGLHVSHRIKHFGTVLRSRASSNLCTRGRKHSRIFYRGRTLSCNTNAETEDLTIQMEADFRLYAASQNGKKCEPDLKHTRRNQDDRKWFCKLPIKEQCEDLDIEEGQIVMAEPADNHLAKIQACETAGVTYSERKEKHVYKKARSNNVAEEIDDQRILETMAKMEKRRERFKEIITSKKEGEGKTNSHVDLPMETDKTKLERPIRKRRWVGS